MPNWVHVLGTHLKARNGQEHLQPIKFGKGGRRIAWLGSPADLADLISFGSNEKRSCLNGIKQRMMEQETHHLALAFTWVHLHTHNYTPPTSKVHTHTYTHMKLFKDSESDWLLMKAAPSFWSEYMSTTSHLFIFFTWLCFQLIHKT